MIDRVMCQERGFNLHGVDSSWIGNLDAMFGGPVVITTHASTMCLCHQSQHVRRVIFVVLHSYSYFQGTFARGIRVRPKDGVPQ